MRQSGQSDKASVAFAIGSAVWLERVRSQKGAKNSLTPSEGLGILLSNTRSDTNPWRRLAHRQTTGNLGLPGRVRGEPRLPADGAGDRRARRARLALDRPRAPREPRARGLPEARPDEAAGARA